MKTASSVSIINNYNYIRHLGRAIDSALTQTGPHIKIIVVDDGSASNWLGAHCGLCWSRAMHFQPSSGQASAFNVGFPVNASDIVLSLNSDDVLEPQVLPNGLLATLSNGTVLPRTGDRGIMASWQFSKITRRKQARGSDAFPVLGLMPRSILARSLKPLFSLEARRASLASFAGVLFKWSTS